MKKILLILLFISLGISKSFCQVDSIGLLFKQYSYVQIPHISAYDFGRGDFTVEAWLNMKRYQSSVAEIINMHSNKCYGIRIVYIPADSELVMVIDSFNYVFNSIVLNDNVCHHLAINCISGQANLYIDGINKGAFASTGWGIDGEGSSPLYIADSYTDLGFMQELRFWNIGLNQSDIQSTMNTQLTGNEMGLVGYWKFNDGSGQAVKDYSPNANNGQLGSPSSMFSYPLFTAGCKSCSTPVSNTVTANGPTTYCQGGSVTLTAPAGYVYQWFQSGYSYGSGDTNRTYTPTFPGTYYCVISNSCGGNILSNPMVIVINNNANITISTNTFTFCNDSTATLSANTAYNNRYQWYYNFSPLSGDTLLTYTASQPGDYYCRATSAACGSSNSNTIHFYGNIPPVAVITPDGGTNHTIENCNGYPVTLTVTPYSDYLFPPSYAWIKDNVYNDLYDDYDPLPVTSPGIYYCIVNYSCGQVYSPSVEVKVLPASPFPVDAPDYKVGCEGANTISLNVSTFWNAVQWQKNDTDVSLGTSPYYNPASSGWYRCNVSNSCASQYTDSVFVDIITADITASGPTNLCNGNSVTLSAPSPPAASGDTYLYRWFSNPNLETNQQSITIYGSPGSRIYYLTVSRVDGGCSVYNSVTIITNPNPVSNFSIYPVNGQPHHYTIVNNASGVAPLNYYWSWGDGTSDTIPYPSHVYADSGYYTICLAITDSAGCTNTSCDSSYHVMRQSSGNTMIYIDVIPPITTGLAETNQVDGLQIYPNPVKNFLTVKTSFTGTATVSIMNMLGQLTSPPTPLLEERGDAVIDVSQFSAGVYFLQLKSESGTAVKMFVKE